MKMIIKISTFIILELVVSLIKGQEIITKDPLLQFKNFQEIVISVNGIRVNTNFTAFKTKNGIYKFEKGEYRPSCDFFINYVWLIKDKHNNIRALKTGVGFVTKRANLVDSIGTDLIYSEELIQIPL